MRSMMGAVVAMIAVAAAAGAAAVAAERTAALPAPMVYLRDIDPSILQDMRYAQADNFTGRRVPGYEAGECILLRPVAQALARVQADLRERQLSLKVYDCYRPERAVRAFAAWAQQAETGATKRYYPRLDKRALIGGYIAYPSTHSRGNTVDLTLVSLPAAAEAAAFDPAAKYGPCTGPAAERAPDTGVDMGTGFDCFDSMSHTASPALTPEQRRWRVTLVEAMARRGFRNFSREWWHFTHASSSGPAFDFPVRAAAPRS